MGQPTEQGQFFNTAGLGNSIAGGIAQGGLNILNSWLSNKWAGQREKTAREENYKYGEQAADAADARTRALYNDLYSPQAQMQQIKDAGLSPSIYASGGISGKSGTSGAMGTGASGVNPQTFGIAPVSALEAAQIGLINSQTKKNEVDSEGSRIENLRKTYASMLEAMQEQNYRAEFEILNTTLQEKGSKKYTTLADIAKGKTFEEFMNYINNDTELDKHKLDLFNTENGQRVLRGIYLANNQLQKEINTLSADIVSEEFRSAIANELKNTDYVKLSAKEAIEALKSNVSILELTANQKTAWNELLKKFGEEGSNGQIIAVVLGTILQTFATAGSRAAGNVIGGRIGRSI